MPEINRKILTKFFLILLLILILNSFSYLSVPTGIAHPDYGTDCVGCHAQRYASSGGDQVVDILLMQNLLAVCIVIAVVFGLAYGSSAQLRRMLKE